MSLMWNIALKVLCFCGRHKSVHPFNVCVNWPIMSFQSGVTDHECCVLSDHRPLTGKGNQKYTVRKRPNKNLTAVECANTLFSVKHETSAP